jgi:hypothetical protein
MTCVDGTCERGSGKVAAVVRRFLDVGTNIPGKPRVYMPYIGNVPVCAAKCEQVGGDGYDDFALS